MCQTCKLRDSYLFLQDSGGMASSMSKNQKKRARKKLKKAEEESRGESSCDLGREPVEGVRECVKEETVVRDPVAELRLKISEAKANKVIG